MFSKGLQKRASIRDAVNDIESGLQLIDEACEGFQAIVRARKDDLAEMDTDYMRRLDALASGAGDYREKIAGILYRAEQLHEKGQL